MDGHTHVGRVHTPTHKLPHHLGHGNGLLMRRCERKRQKRRTCQLSEESEDKQIVAHSLLFIRLHHGEGSLFLKPVICHFLSNLFLHCAIFHYVWADASVCYQALKNPRILRNSVGAQTSCLVHKDRVRHEKKLHPHSHTRTCSLQKKPQQPTNTCVYTLPIKLFCLC